MKVIKYPRDIKSVITESSSGKEKIYHTMSLAQYLDACDDDTVIDADALTKEERLQDPLKIFTPWSVFKITLIEKRVDKKHSVKRSVCANIPVGDLALLERKTAICAQRIMEDGMKVSTSKISDTSPTSPAYTQKIAVGSYQNRGKTPAQVLLNNPESRKELLDTADWLQRNIERHEGNARQYEAIKEAIDLFDRGALITSEAMETQAADMIVYSVPSKTLPKTNEAGKRIVYGIKISCNPSHRYPYKINISTYYAECKGILPIAGTIEGRQDITMSISESDWEDMLDTMRSMKNLFIQIYGPGEYGRALRAEEQARKNANLKKAGVIS